MEPELDEHLDRLEDRMTKIEGRTAALLILAAEVYREAQQWVREAS